MTAFPAPLNEEEPLVKKSGAKLLLNWTGGAETTATPFKVFCFFF
jgi:hypothetical protein